MSLVIARLNYPDDYYRRETNRADDPKDLPQRHPPAFDAPGHPAIDTPDQPTQTPRRHPRLICPLCKSSQVNRVGRRSVWDYLLSVIYLYPFKCAACKHGFRVIQWGVRYRRMRRS